MMKRMLSVFVLCVPMMVQAQYKSQVWSPDNGDGTYTNPVINADYSDPDVCVGASGEDYYMTASSFQCVPGLPIISASPSMGLVSGHRASVTTMAGTISTGVIPTSVCIW